MQEFRYELDRESIESLQSLIGQEINLITQFANFNFNQRNVTCFPPLYFRKKASFVELTNEWNTSPQGHDFHLPKFRLVQKPDDIEYQSDNDSIGPCSEIKFTENDRITIEAIEILRLRCRCAVQDETEVRKLIPSDEVVIYDWGINIRLSDGSYASITTEDDHITGELIISPLAIEAYHKEDIWVQQLDIRQVLTII
ncbi:hypothetical protein CXF83_10725 [Shewanella sp. Choline-02u-19]|uniref:hypothetical protein n=1 Tax=unclassified Shewanella TaxID=196818 RepID=UPI000C328752|nr:MULTISPECIES: hypothetical protein [unclassified Shewanella]PKH59294.1 hypothetical protein CXF84_04330 [Shewanella sp. Bg11-22]PKI27169.1 hypothetical protein CXF83_10725 [Shewanella sp. Choline-02u-19]